MERTTLSESIIHAMRQQSATTVFFHSAVAQRMGLGYSDHKCLDLMLRKGPMFAGQLAEETGLTTGAITGIINRLVKAGYVHRTQDAVDRRKVLVEPIWDKAHADFWPVFEPLSRETCQLLDKYSDIELKLVLEFIQACDAIVERNLARLVEERSSEI